MKIMHEEDFTLNAFGIFFSLNVNWLNMGSHYIFQFTLRKLDRVILDTFVEDMSKQEGYSMVDKINKKIIANSY